ncbi:MAG: helix-turn-helix domain-containing protein [Paracoccaceae bacterium]
MNQPLPGTTRISGIAVAKDRFVSVNGPPLTRSPSWGLTLKTPQVEYHLCPAITYELHYQLPLYVVVHMFNSSRGRYGVGSGPLYESVTEAHRTGLVPPNMAIRAIQDAPLEYLVIRIAPERFNRIAGTAAPGWSGLEHIFKTVDPALTALCIEMRRCMIIEPMGMGDYLDALTDAVTTRLVSAHLAVRSDEAEGPEMLSPAMARRVAGIIEDRLDGPIKVADLADEAGLSRAHFTRSFVRNFGAPPRDYILSRRIARARTMLTDTDYSASEIAMRCGFANPSHLTTAFKQELGLTPTAYRRALASSS